MNRYFDGRYWRVPTTRKRYRYEHDLVMESVIGRPMTASEEVHHKDDDGTNNDPSNLHLCASHAEHMALERAARALRDCGHADWMICGYCGLYDAPSNLYIYTPKRRQPRGFHKVCNSNYKKERWRTLRK
jgi:hypothetical protein